MYRKRKAIDLDSSYLSGFFEENLQSFARIRKFLSLLHCKQFFGEAPNLVLLGKAFFHAKSTFYM